MGLDLALVVDQWPYSRTMGLGGFTRLGLDRDLILFEAIKKLNPQKLNCDLAWYDDEGLEMVREDAYGAPLMFLMAGQLKGLKDRVASSMLNEAAMAYLAAIDPERIIVLYWH